MTQDDDTDWRDKKRRGEKEIASKLGRRLLASDRIFIGEACISEDGSVEGLNTTKSPVCLCRVRRSCDWQESTYHLR